MAGTTAVGVGLAWAAKLRKQKYWTVVTFGDAAVEEGVFHESANFASLHQLRVLFVCENNEQSCYTPLVERQPKRSLRMLAQAHALNYDVTYDDEGADEIASRTRRLLALEHPAFLEVQCHRHMEHCGPAREQGPFAGDPLEICDDETNAEIDAAFHFAEMSPEPTKAVGMYAD